MDTLDDLTHPPAESCITPLMLDPTGTFPLHSYILEYVFRYLNPKDLKTCRLVDNTWCDEASRSMAISKLWSRVRITWERNASGLVKLEHLKTVLIRCTVQEHVLTHLETTFCWMKNKTFVEILKVLGSNLKTLEVAATASSTEFAKEAELLLIILNSSCPKLKELQITSQGCLLHPLDLSELIPFPHSCNLNLTSITLKGSNIMIKSLSYCTSLIRCSPKLRILRVMDIIGTVMIQFLEKLVFVPEVTKNLEEFMWTLSHEWERTFKFMQRFDQDCRFLKAITAMTFSNNLKTLGLGSANDNSDGRYIPKILKGIAGSLENLVLDGLYQIKNSVSLVQAFGLPPELLMMLLEEELGDLGELGLQFPVPNQQDELEMARQLELRTSMVECWPTMHYLKSLKISSMNNYGIPFIFFLDELPNLSFFWLECKSKDPEGVNLSPACIIDDFFGNGVAPYFHLHVPPHLHLKSLHLKNRICKVRSLNYIIKCFPNLTSLHLGIGPSEPVHSCELKIAETVRRVAELKEIKDFGLFIQTLQYSSDPQDIENAEISEISFAISHLQNFEKLESFTLTDADWAHERCCKLEDIKEVIYKIRHKNIRLALNGLMIYEDPKGKDLLEYAKSNGISLEWNELDKPGLCNWKYIDGEGWVRSNYVHGQKVDPRDSIHTGYAYPDF